MHSFFICAKFLDTQVEWGVEPNHYTVGALWMDVFMYTCGTLPEPTETCKIEVKLPWNGNYMVIEDDDALQNVFNMFRDRGLTTLRINFTLIPMAAAPVNAYIPEQSQPTTDVGGNMHANAPDSMSDSIMVISSDNDDSIHVHASSKAYANTSSDEDFSYFPSDHSSTVDVQSSGATSDTEVRVRKLATELGYELDAKSDTSSDNVMPKMPPHVNSDGHAEVDNSHGDYVSNTSSDEAPLRGGHGATTGKQPVNNTVFNESDEDAMSNAASFDPLQQEILISSSDDEVECVKTYAMKKPLSIPYEPVIGGRVVLKVGHLFKCHKHFKQVLRDYVVQEGFNITRIKNARYRFTATCAAEGCNWRIHASNHGIGHGFKIKTLNERHSCIKSHKISEANAVWVARKFGDMIREHPDIKVSLLRSEIHRQYGVKIPTYTLHRAKHRVLEVTDEDHTNSYNKLYSYGYVVRDKNPSSTVFVRTISSPVPNSVVFQRFFISFHAQKFGFLKGCRPLLFVDGCHLKGRYPGVVLAACAIDANNGVFPLAFCIAEAEDKWSWGWFMEQLHHHIGHEETRKIAFMFDRQKGFLEAIANCWPNSVNRFCVRHLIANLQKDHKGDQVPLHVWKAANASCEREFKAEMASFKLANTEAHDWLMKISLDSWCVHKFETHVKATHCTNNVAESFNGWIDKHRGLPALYMVENFRRKLMKRMHKRFHECSKWTSNLPPTIMNKLAARMEEARYVTVLCASDKEFEVKDGLQFDIVSLETRTCTCRLWEVSGIPCKHALAVFSTMRLNAIDFVDWYLTKDAYIMTYANVIHPIPSQDVWPEVEHAKVLPPEKKRQPGRPRKCRRRGLDEKRAQKRSGPGKCSKCGGGGHNLRTCGTVNRRTRRKNKKAQKNRSEHEACPNNSAAPPSATSYPNAMNANHASISGLKRRLNFDTGEPSNARDKGKGKMPAQQNLDGPNVTTKRMRVENQHTQTQTTNAPAQSSFRASQSTHPTPHHGGAVYFDWSNLL